MSNTETSTQAEKRDVLELYGGIDKVMKRMTLAVREGLLRKCEEIKSSIKKGTVFTSSCLEAIARKLYIPSHVNFGKILNYEEPASYVLFDRLEGPLDLNILKVLGKPDLSDPKLRKYWLNEVGTHRMGPRIPGMSLDGELELCLGLMAIKTLKKADYKNYSY